MPVYTDQIGNQINLQSEPKRIVSLVPSQTELLYDLGLDTSVIGITKFCVHPTTWFKQKTRIGGTKTVQIEKVAALNPDLILANKEENVKEQIEALQKIAPVWVSDIAHLDDAIEMIEQIGLLTATTTMAEKIKKHIVSGFKQIQPLSPAQTVCYLIWREPYMTVGGDTFINHMLNHCGFKNIFAQENRYPQISIAELESLKPALILLSSEPYPFKEKHIAELKKFLPEAQILLVDGEMFSWYGSRLQKSALYFSNLLSRLKQELPF